MNEFKRWILEAKKNLQVSCLFLWTGRLCLLWVRVQHEGGSYPKRAGDQCVQLGTAVPWWGAPSSSWGHPLLPGATLLLLSCEQAMVLKRNTGQFSCVLSWGWFVLGFFSKIHVQNLKQLKWGDCSDVSKWTEQPPWAGGISACFQVPAGILPDLGLRYTWGGNGPSRLRSGHPACRLREWEIPEMREAPGGSASSDEASGFVPPFSGWEAVWRQSEAPASGGAPSPRLWDAALWSRQGLL